MPFLLVLASLGCAGFAHAAGTIRLLAIGNSFTGPALDVLPQFASRDNRDMVIFPAVLGGTALEAHAQAVRACAANSADPAGQPYRDGRLHLSLHDALEAETWDYVSIQESIGHMGHPDNASTDRSLKTLVELVRSLAPQAKILFFEPWSPREQKSPVPDDPTSSQEFYERIHAQTLQLAAKYNLTVLPVGTAFQNARHTVLWRITTPNPNFDYKKPVGPAPDQSNDLIAGWTEHDANRPASRHFSFDNIHASAAGRYLAAAVIYEMISGTDVRKLQPAFNDVSPDRRKNLCEIAHTTVLSARAWPVPTPAATP